MSETGVEVKILEVTNTVVSNTILVINALATNSNVTINSTSLTIFAVGSNTTINSTSIRISNATNSATLAAISNTPYIVVNSVSYSKLYTETMNVQIFTANGIWQRPSWANTGKELIVVNMWGAGGPGGGGAFAFGYSNGSFPSQITNASGTFCNVIVGTGNSTSRTSEFYYTNTRVLRAYGGGAYSGGGWTSQGDADIVGFGGGPVGGATAGDFGTFGGGANGGYSIYGGGGANTAAGGAGGNSFYGGGGYGTTTRGTSIYGGFGGNTTTLPTAPGGGGNSSVGGARGEVRVFTLRYLPYSEYRGGI